MKGVKSAETQVAVSAGLIWEVYRGLELGRLVNQLLPDVIGKVETLQGDGDVGTILKLNFPPGTPGIGYLKERFTKVDDANRVKEIEVIEGGLLDIGFDVWQVRLEIIEKDSETAIIRSSMVYEIDDSKADLVSFVSTKNLEIGARTIGKYLAQNRATAS